MESRKEECQNNFPRECHRFTAFETTTTSKHCNLVLRITTTLDSGPMRDICCVPIVLRKLRVLSPSVQKSKSVQRQNHKILVIRKIRENSDLCGSFRNNLVRKRLPLLSPPCAKKMVSSNGRSGTFFLDMHCVVRSIAAIFRTHCKLQQTKRKDCLRKFCTN